MRATGSVASRVGLSRGLAAVLFLVLALAALAGGDQPASPQAPPTPPTLFGGRTGVERTRMAVSNTFYLELELGAKELRICHSGVAVGTFPISNLTVAYPRVLFISRGHTGDWVDDIWKDARLDPAKVVQRVKIVPGDTATIPTPDKPGVVPPTMEELTPVPQDFVVRCEGERALFIHLDGQVAGAVLADSVKSSRWDDFLEALGLRESESLRLNATMSAADGAAFFRSFPDATPVLFVLP